MRVQRSGILLIAVLFVTTGAAAAEPDAKVAPIQKIEGVQVKESIFEAASAKNR